MNGIYYVLCIKIVFFTVDVMRMNLMLRVRVSSQMEIQFTSLAVVRLKIAQLPVSPVTQLVLMQKGEEGVNI